MENVSLDQEHDREDKTTWKPRPVRVLECSKNKARKYFLLRWKTTCSPPTFTSMVRSCFSEGQSWAGK